MEHCLVVQGVFDHTYHVPECDDTIATPTLIAAAVVILAAFFCSAGCGWVCIKLTSALRSTTALPALAASRSSATPQRHSTI